jgi:hypothetical protein
MLSPKKQTVSPSLNSSARAANTNSAPTIPKNNRFMRDLRTGAARHMPLNRQHGAYFAMFPRPGR